MIQTQLVEVDNVAGSDRIGIETTGQHVAALVIRVESVGRAVAAVLAVITRRKLMLMVMMMVVVVVLDVIEMARGQRLFRVEVVALVRAIQIEIVSLMMQLLELVFIEDHRVVQVLKKRVDAEKEVQNGSKSHRSPQKRSSRLRLT